MADDQEPISKFDTDNGGLDALLPKLGAMLRGSRRFLLLALSETVLTFLIEERLP
jgi:hypothetical protein